MTALGLSFRVWNDLHTWAGFALIAGVAAHLVLHWNWIVCMTKRMVFPERREPAVAPACQSRPGGQDKPVKAGATGKGMSRRVFLALGGTAAVTCLAAGCGALALSHHSRVHLLVDEDAGELESQTVVPEPTATSRQSTPTTSIQEIPMPEPTATAVTLGVACRKGRVNDPYPGQCHDYVDRDGDGICDLSILGSGSYLPRNG